MEPSERKIGNEIMEKCETLNLINRARRVGLCEKEEKQLLSDRLLYDNFNIRMLHYPNALLSVSNMYIFYQRSYKMTCSSHIRQSEF